jgi:hypothetical protein
MQLAVCSWQGAVGKGQFAEGSLQRAVGKSSLCVNSVFSFLSSGKSDFKSSKENVVIRKKKNTFLVAGISSLIRLQWRRSVQYLFPDLALIMFCTFTAE